MYTLFQIVRVRFDISVHSLDDEKRAESTCRDLEKHIIDIYDYALFAGTNIQRDRT